MTLLAIDPGSTHSALVVWDGAKILKAEKLPNDEAKRSIGNLIALLDVSERKAHCTLIDPVVKHVVCERVECYGMPVGREVFDTVYWSGQVWQMVESTRTDSPFRLISRREVKLHLCGQARAKDSNIRQALVDRFGGKGTKANKGLTYGLKADLWQAFALAVYFYDTHNQTV